MKLSQELLLSKPANIIFDILNDEVRFVGGCVRDSLIGQPIKDIDMATTCTPDKLIEICKHHNIRTIPTGIKHGTVTILIDGVCIEVTTLRRDTSCDGRHADVDFTTSWREDASRRDFTMNALYADRSGKIYDYFDGISDLKKREIRFVGNAEDRCREDILRILRFFRFNAHYGKTLDKQALEACKKHAKNIPNLSGERINSEIFKLISAPDPIKILQLMRDNGILKFITGDSFNIKLCKDLLAIKPNYEAILRLAALIKNACDLDYLIKYWKLSNKQKVFLQTVLSKNILPTELDSKHAKIHIRKYGKEYFTAAAAIAQAESKNPKYQDLINIANNWEIPQLPLCGKDLIAKDVKAGKEIGRLLKKAENWWEAENYAPSKQDLLNYLDV